MALLLSADAAVCLFAPHLLAPNLKATGFPIELAPAIGAVLAVSVLLYLWPRTSMVGAILITGFLGGAICTHVRIGEFGSPSQIVSVLLGVGVWGSLYLRHGALRALLPLAARSQ